MKFGDFTSTNESLPLGGEGNVADQESGVTPAVPNDPQTNQITDDTIPTDVSEEEIEKADETSQAFDSELDQSNKVSDNLHDAAKTLDELQNSANNMVVAEEVITPAGQVAIEQTLESIYRKLDIQKPTLPSLEAYKGKWTKKDASRLTMEALNTAGTSVAGRIVSTIKALMGSVWNFLTGLFRNRKLMEVHISKLIQRAETLSDSLTPKTATLKGRFVAALEFNGRTNYHSTNLILGTAISACEYYGNIYKAIQQLRDSRDPSKEIIQFESIIGNVVKQKIGTTEGSIEAYGAFVNGRSMFYEERSNYTTVRFIGNSMAKPGAEAPALNKNEILQTLTSAKYAISELRRVESTSARLFDAIKGIMRSIENQYNSLRGAMGSQDHEAKSKAYKESMQTQSLLSDLVGRLPNMIFSAVNNASKYALASMNNLH